MAAAAHAPAPGGWYHSRMKHDTIGSGRPSGRGVRPPVSGRFLLRLDPRLHRLLRMSAAAAGISLNEWCGRSLAAPGGGGSAAAADVMLAIREWLGDRLLGVVVYGSFARGEAAAGSDVDLLVVVADDMPITRTLYRDWDAAVPTWDGREVDIHLVHLPAVDAPLSGTWAEAAVCGIMLFDRDHVVSRRLVDIRMRIAAGESVRRLAQGQPYWVHAVRDAES
jgi:predicted nucleotidyltransferase